MPFVTRLTLESGDSDLLEAVVADIKRQAERKGVELKGPHPEPPRQLTVAQHKRTAAEGTFDPWTYTIYARVIEVIGHGGFARGLAERRYPDRIHVRADIEQLTQTGG